MLRFTSALAALAVLAALGFLLFALSPEAIEPIPAQPRSAFSELAIERGQRVALLGNCNVCHTKAGEPSYSGGYGVETPFGTIYGTNITPEPDTGIGGWSFEAFERAMRSGIGREGEHLYPAFPYDHFTKLSDGDVSALYAFLMTRDPVRRETEANDLPFFMRWRPLLAGWKLLGFTEGRFEPEASADPQIEYGRYLVEGAGHCGACHTPRNLIQAEKISEALRGGQSAGWTAPAIAGPIEVSVPWTAETLETYLRDGFSSDHGAGSGPMQPVGVNLARTPTEDAAAISRYLLSVMDQEIRPAKEAGTAANGEGEALFQGACFACHGGSAPGNAQGITLDKSSATHESEPRNLVNFILHGRQPSQGTQGAAMPGFAGVLTRAQIAEITAYVRARYSTEPPFAELKDTVDQLADKAGLP